MDRSEWVAKGLNLDICDPNPIRRRLLQPRNIVQLTSIQMLGCYNFARQTSSTFNTTMERHFIHGINGARCDQFSENEKICPKYISLPLGDKTQKKNNENTIKATGNWVQIIMSDSFEMQAGLVAESMIWSQYKKPVPASLDSDPYFYQFYHINPNNLEFSLVSKETINGKIIKRKVLEYRDKFSIQPIKIMMTLTDKNHLYAFDMHHQCKTIDAIHLSVDNPMADYYSYSNFELVYDEEIVIVMGIEKYRDLQCILVFNYPPEMRNVSVIHTGHIGMDYTFHNSYCFMYKESRDLIVSSWQSFCEQTISIPPTGFNPTTTPLVQLGQELTINDLPTSNINMYLQSPIVNFINIEPPMIYKHVFDGIQFFTITPSDDEAELPKYQFRGVEGELGGGNSKVITFPDKSPRVVITNPDVYEDAVVTFTINSNVNGRVRGQRSNPFHVNSMQRENTDNQQSTLAIDPRRTTERKQCVMGLSYCEKTNMLAVLFCKNHSFQVKLYHPNSFEMVKSFPVVKRNCAWRFSINLLEHVFMQLQPDMLFVEFVFNMSAINPIREVYICGLMQETTQRL